MFETESLGQVLIKVAIALCVIVYVFFKWRYQYWKRAGANYLEPRIPNGNVENVFHRTKHSAYIFQDIYHSMKSKGWKHGGVFFLTKPTYFLVDLDYVKLVLTKDFQYFSDRGVYHNEETDPLSAHLFSIAGEKWRNLRMKLSPTFTSGKMKSMFHTLVDCTPFLQEKIVVENSKGAIDIKDVLGCFTTDIIGSCAFGLDCKTFQGESPFRTYGKKIFEGSPSRNAKMILAINFPWLARFLRVKITLPEVENFFLNLVNDTVNYREKNNVVRKDFLQLLIDLKNTPSEEGATHDGKSLTMLELAAQSFIFFVAGFETSSTTMTFALYELAKNQDIQKQLRKEVNEVLGRHQGNITYDAIQEMKYMDKVIDETLRKYPPVPILFRKCVKDYKLPNEDVVIKKGVRVSIPVLAIHYDEEIFPNPEEFDPERFNEKNTAARHHYAHLPFGEGPRNCIGMLRIDTG